LCDVCRRGYRRLVLAVPLVIVHLMIFSCGFINAMWGEPEHGGKDVNGE
jgi:hypothetical protein